MKVSERAAWVGVGYYEHGKFFGAAINSKSLHLKSKCGIATCHVVIFCVIYILYVGSHTELESNAIG